MDENEFPTLVEPTDTGTGGATTATAPPPTPPPPPPPTYPVRPQLRRSRTDRVLAGVCGGIARQYGIDAVLLRILVVVATLFSGGVFLIAYVLAWLFIADDPVLVPVAAPGQPGTQPPSQPVAYAAGGTGSYVDPATGQVYGTATPAAYAPPPRTEPRSYLGLLTVSAAVVVGALLALVDTLGAHVSGLVILAAMLAVLGIGLLVGGWRGRARWLIAPALVVLLLVQGTAAVHHLVGSTAGIGDRRWTPVEVTQSYQLGAGNAVVDLRKQLYPDSDVAVKVGLGEVTVILPADVTLVVDAQVGLGEIDLPGDRPQQGSNLTVIETVQPTTLQGIKTVNLKADIGLGQLVVRRATS